MNDIELMLNYLKLKNIEQLFSDIPGKARVDKLSLPDGLTETEVVVKARNILSKNQSSLDMPIFIGAGIYNHYVPAAVHAIVSRSEFYTAYTPYQPEISQGMLQTLFEYQSYIAELTGMDIANASMYDGATALGEAARMSYAIRNGKNILIPQNILPEKKMILRLYLKGLGLNIIEYPFNRSTGSIDLEKLQNLIDMDTVAVYAEMPNFFGILDKNVLKIRELNDKVIFIVGVNPITLGIIKPPGEYGADIVVGEGQALGNHMNFGGPLLGIFATKTKFVRKMPGRLIGMTTDVTGKRAYVMTLQTREQHIRRARATSNICSNESLCAVASTAYLALLGGKGLRELAEVNMKKANKVFNKIAGIQGYAKAFPQALHFNECLFTLPRSEQEVHEALLEHNIHGGYLLNTNSNNEYNDLGPGMIINVTEMHTDDDIALLLNALKEVQ